MMKYKFGQRSIDNLKGVHHKVVTVMMESIKDSPVDFTIVCGVRTTKEQQAFYAIGRTLPGKIVTRCDGVALKSKHQVAANGFGHAVDIYPFFNGRVQVNHLDTAKCLKKISTHIKKVAKDLNVNIKWGGDFKGFVDMPHFELE